MKINYNPKLKELARKLRNKSTKSEIRDFKHTEIPFIALSNFKYTTLQALLIWYISIYVIPKEM